MLCVFKNIDNKCASNGFRPICTAELLECLPDYKRAFEGHSEEGYSVSMEPKLSTHGRRGAMPAPCLVSDVSTLRRCHHHQEVNSFTVKSIFFFYPSAFSQLQTLAPSAPFLFFFLALCASRHFPM